MALIALVNKVLPDPMLLHIVSSFHGDFRVEVKVLSLKRYWLAQNQELVRQHREKVEDILVWCMHRVGRFFHEEREAYWEDAADRAPAIPLPDIDRDEHSSSWGPEVIHQSPQTLANMVEAASDFSPSEGADAGGWGSSGSGIGAAGRPGGPASRLRPVPVASSSANSDANSDAHAPAAAAILC